MLTLLAGASLTGPGHELFEKSVSRLRLFKGYGSKRRLIVAGILLLVVVGVRLSTGKFALSAYNQGFTYQNSNDLTKATESYQRALCLAPGYSVAHYGLATILEKKQPKDAIKEYMLAIQYDSRFYAAYNNLARVLIMQKDDNDYASALQLLNQAKSLEPNDPRVQYSLYKNLGWASLKRKNYAESEMYLRHAISLCKPNEGAAAHCLLASLLNERKDLELPKLHRKAIVHPHCHQRSMTGMKSEEDVLIRLGLDFQILDSGCCGMAGAFGFEDAHYELSMRCGERVLFPSVRGISEDALLLTNGFSCREQILQGTGKRALHLGEVLKMACSGPAKDV